MARNKVPLPDTAEEWLSGYLERRGIDAARYPNGLDTLEWQRLKTAYRQHALQQTRIAAVNGADQSQPDRPDITELEKNHKKQINYLNDIIEKLNDKPLKIRNDELKAKVVTLVAEVKTLEASVAELLKSNGKVNRKPRTEITPEIKEKIENLLVTGKTQQSIADELNVSVGTVRRIKKEYLAK